MQIRVEPRDHCTVLHLKGEFDSFQCKPFLAEFEKLQDDGMTDVAVNLLRVPFINSTALGTLIKSSKMAKRSGGKMVISSPSSVCRRVIDAVGLSKVLPIFENDDEAERHLSGGTEAAADELEKEFDDDESAVLFAPVDTSLVERFIRASQRSNKPVNPVHGHTFGGSWRGVARMAAVENDGVRFVWDQSNSRIEPARMAEMLAPGVELNIKFRLPLMQRRLSDATVAVDSVETRDNDVKVAASFSKIKAKTLEAVQQYVKDMQYLKKELKRGNS